MSAEAEPVVSIGLPTYNRAAKLRRAVESVLAQDYAHIELIVSDNASEDETEAVCREFCRRDARVRYVRQPVNRGMTANYNEVFKHARGRFFMWLSDDDYLDHTYVSRCLSVLLARPDHALACGRAKHFRGADWFFDTESDLLDESGRDRVLAYYRTVGRNNTFYGVMRSEQVARAPLPNALGGDWILGARLVFLGKARFIEGVHINRTCEGTSEDLARLARGFGLSEFAARHPHLSIAFNAFRDVAWGSPVYGSMSRFSRLRLGVGCALLVIQRFVLPRWEFRAYEWLSTSHPRLKRAIKGIQRRRAAER